MKATSSPVKDSRGVVYRLVTTMRDITKEVERERELRQAQKMETTGELAAGLVQHSNNTLSVILMAAEIIKEKLPLDSSVLSKVETILQTASCAAERNKQILSFISKSERECLPLEISVITADVLQRLRGTLPANIELQSEIMDEVWVEGDPGQFQQIILNLSTNAVQAMYPNGGQLYVSLIEVLADEHSPLIDVAENRYAMLTVKDSGCGMDAPTLERIFDPFFTANPKGEGTGLGLSLVQACVTKHGGKIVVSSNPGEGTEFRVYWPCIAMGETALKSKKRVASVPVTEFHPGKEGLILLVEDSRVTRVMLKASLERAGCEVIGAQDGLEAWELFTKGPDHGRFSLVLTDVRMPRMDGLELTRLIRKLDPSMPIAIFSSNEDKEIVKLALNLGVDTFLSKPFDASELIECVDRLLAVRQSRLTTGRSAKTAQEVRRVQKTLVPAPEKGLPILSLYKPLTDAGGDAFRCMKCADGSLLFILADVVGHSVLSSYAAASFLAMLSTHVGECATLMAVRTGTDSWDSDAQSLPHFCGYHGKIPCNPLRHLAQKLNRSIQTGPFSRVPICALLGLWTPATGRLQLLNAGIPHGLIGHHGSLEAVPIEINGTPLGIFSDPILEECILQLEPGDRILFGTDGFFDVLSPSKQPFHEVASTRWSALRKLPIDLALHEICEEVRNHGNGLITDDLLVIGFEQPEVAQ